MEHLYAVIMAGGAGTRFWPASRRARPKQYLAVAGGESLIEETAARLEGLVPRENVLVVTAGAQAPLVRECLPSLPARNVLVEPAGRNTAACVALAAFEIARRDPEAVQCVLPADHVIRPARRFRRSLAAAVAEARRAHGLVTLGIVPDHAATGYGYIEQGAKIAEHDGIGVHAVERFVEKPDAQRAREFVASGRFRWNAGIFVWETGAILAAVREHAPAIHAVLERATTPAELERAYRELPSVPVDVAVMEKASNRSVLPIDYFWSDVGSWASLAEVLEADADGNCKSGGGELVAEGARGCVVYGEGGLTALIGVEDLVVVRAGDTTLVCPKDRAQDVRCIIARLEQHGERFL